MRKKFFGLALGTLLLALCFPVEAQQPKKVPRVGFLSVRAGIEPREEAFRQSLRELGYVEGQNIVIDGALPKVRQIAFLNSQLSWSGLK